MTSISVAGAMSEWLRELILATGSVMERQSRYKDDLAFWVDGREVAHFEAHDVLDLRLTRAVIAKNRQLLKEEPRVELRGSSDWVTVRVSGPADVGLVMLLFEWAVEANKRG